MINISLIQSRVYSQLGPNAQLSAVINNQKLTANGIQLSDMDYGQLPQEDIDLLADLKTKGFITITKNGVSIKADELESVGSLMATIAGANGGSMVLKSYSEVVIIGIGEGLIGVGGAVLSGNVLVPADSVFLGASARVLTAPGGGATTFDMGRDSKAADELIDGAASALGTTGNSLSHATPVGFVLQGGTGDKMELSTDADVTVSAMRILVVTYVAELTDPTSNV